MTKNIIMYFTGSNRFSRKMKECLKKKIENEIKSIFNNLEIVYEKD